MSHPNDPSLAAVTAYGPMELSDEEFYAFTDRSLAVVGWSEFAK